VSAPKIRLVAIGKRVYHSLTLTHLSAWFSGRIPTELGRLTALMDLRLCGNQLTGECDYKTRLIAIGKRVYHSFNLTRLPAWFSGRIPTELGQLTALALLYLNGNQLTGACD